MWVLGAALSGRRELTGVTKSKKKKTSRRME